MTSVSIIIPTLNEATCLQKMLPHLSLLLPTAKEIIIVDGGSEDRTLLVVDDIASQFFPPSVIQLLQTSRGRGKQLNAGVNIATGDYLCFLHADTFVPPDLVDVISKVLSDPGIACAGFISLMRGCKKTRWLISLHNFLKTYYAPLIFRPWLFFRNGLRLLFGDQVMFCRRQDFIDCGSFDATLPIMEEADLCLRLCHYGRIKQINRIVESSDRRVEKWGVLRANFIYLMIGSLWGMGVPANWLKQFYEEVR